MGAYGRRIVAGVGRPSCNFEAGNFLRLSVNVLNWMYFMSGWRDSAAAFRPLSPGLGALADVPRWIARPPNARLAEKSRPGSLK
jgi:hypothetical protein